MSGRIYRFTSSGLIDSKSIDTESEDRYDQDEQVIEPEGRPIDSLHFDIVPTTHRTTLGGLFSFRHVSYQSYQLQEDSDQD